MTVFAAVAERIILVEAYPYDPDAAATTTVRVADRDYATGPGDTPASVHFDGFLLAASYQRSLFAPSVVRGGSVGLAGALRIGNPSRDEVGQTGRKLDAWLGYRWQGRRFKVWLLEVGQAFSTRTQILAGSLGNLRQDGGDLILEIRDRKEDLRKDIQASLYSGAGGFNGGADLANRSRPIGLGLDRKVPAPMVDPANLWLDAHYGPIQADLGCEDQGVPLTPSASNPPPAGNYYTALATGRYRLGSSPNGEVRVSFRGDASNTAVGYVSTHADVFRRAACDWGPLDDPDDLDTASFTAANVANSAEMGIWIGTEPRAVADVLDEIMASFGGWWIFTPLDKVKIGQFAAPTAIEATADLVITDYDIVEGTLRRLPMDTPPWQLIGRYKRYYGPLDRTALAGSVSEADKADYGREWRQVAKNTTATLTEFPFSVPLTVDQLVDGSAAAQTETDRQAGLHSVARRMFQAQVGLQILAIDLHDQTWIDHPEEGLEDGAAFRLISTDVDLVAGIVTAQFWG